MFVCLSTLFHVKSVYLHPQCIHLFVCKAWCFWKMLKVPHVFFCSCVKPLWHHALYYLYQVGTSRFRAGAMGNEMSPPPAAGAWVTDLQPKKRKATAKLGRERPGVIFLIHLPWCSLILILLSAWWHASTCLSEVQKHMCHLLMLAMCLCEAYYGTIYVMYHILCISLSHIVIQYHCWGLLLFICRLKLMCLYSNG